MRGMNDVEINGPKLPWYRRLVARSREGRKLRRRVFVVLALVTLPYTATLLIGSDPRKLAAILRLGPTPRPGAWAQLCHHAVDCTGVCAVGHPSCVRGGVGADPKIPLSGSCGCLSKEEQEQRHRPPPGCRDAVLVADDDDQQDWKCSGFDPPDGGDGGKP